VRLPKSTFGVDIVGFGPIGRELTIRLLSNPELRKSFEISSISDSSGTVSPRSSRDVLKIVEWKSSGKKIGDFKSAQSKKRTDSSKIVVDVTNSDYSKPEEAKKRATSALSSGKHFVSANKVALSNYFPEIMALAKRKNVEVGYGASICGGAQAIKIVQSFDEGEVRSSSAVLNASTTMILSMLEDNWSLSFEDACKEAAKSGVLESDWSVDLDGVDAAAKTAILANVLFPLSKSTFKDVKRTGIRDEAATAIIDQVRTESDRSKRVRLVSELSPSSVSVGAKLLPSDSPLSVVGRFNAVQLNTKTMGEITVRNLGGGVQFTASVIISDLKQIASAA
jgi:homoserine dehydrogenase